MPRQPGDKPLVSPAVRKRALMRVSNCATCMAAVGAHSARRPRRLHEQAASSTAGAEWLWRNRQPAGAGDRPAPQDCPAHAGRQAPVAHFSYVEEIDVTALEALRQQLNSKHGDSRGKLTLLPFLVRAWWRCVISRRSTRPRRRSAGHHPPWCMSASPRRGQRLMVPVLRHAEAGSQGQRQRDHTPGPCRAQQQGQPRRTVRFDHHPDQPRSAVWSARPW